MRQVRLGSRSQPLRNPSQGHHRFFALTQGNSQHRTTRRSFILLANDSRPVPFQALLEEDYRLVYYDAANRLYAHKVIARKAKR